MHEIRIVSPPVASSNIEHDLYALTEYLDHAGHEAAHGGLGGGWGYGAEYDNDIFEMHPFWWGDCQCGFEDRENDWTEANPHADDCYQTALARRDWQAPHELAAEWGLPEFGCAIHCTCGRTDDYHAWRKTNNHSPACPEVRPNFRHKPSGLEIRWYKYIGRDMEYVPEEPSNRRWAAIFDDCVASIRATL